MTRERGVLVAGGAFVVAVILLASYLVARTPGDELSARVPPAPAAAATGNVDYTLAGGRSARQVGQELTELGVIRSPRLFEVLVSLMGVQGELGAGEYVLPRGASTASVVNRLTVRQNVPAIRVTFPEGLRIEEMAEIAAKAGFGTPEQFLAAAEEAATLLPPEFAEALPPPAALPKGQRMQGYLFPDTYILPVGTTATELVALMVRTLVERFSPDLRAAALRQGLDPHQALTLAAVVEREAVVETERPRIAGVFSNRIAQRDRLDADPTVQFAVALNPASVERFGWWKKDLTIFDLELVSPYNTRLLPGLPPGPIANPGLASIEAVARPEKTKFYYFVADAKANDGSHVFAETLAEHERNIIRVGGAP